MMSCPSSPRMRMRPRGPFVADRQRGIAACALGRGQSVRSGRCPSRVWTTVMPSSRAAARTAPTTGIVGASSETSFPSVSPKPPGSRKSRCMSMITSAVVDGSNAYGYGRASTVTGGASLWRLLEPSCPGDRVDVCSSVDDGRPTEEKLDLALRGSFARWPENGRTSWPFVEKRGSAPRTTGQFILRGRSVGCGACTQRCTRMRRLGALLPPARCSSTFARPARSSSTTQPAASPTAARRSRARGCVRRCAGRSVSPWRSRGSRLIPSRRSRWSMPARSRTCRTTTSAASAP